MTAISDAVILMAGSGSRLRGPDETFLKPFVPVLGRPLICYMIDALIHAGIKKPSFIVNREWQKQNGISLLTAANQVTSPFLLTMSDHLFDRSIVDLLVRDTVLDQLNLAIDRKLDSIFDVDDA